MKPDLRFDTLTRLLPNTWGFRSYRRELVRVEHVECGGPKRVSASCPILNNDSDAQKKRGTVDLWTVGYADTRLTAQARFPMDKPWKTR